MTAVVVGAHGQADVKRLLEREVESAAHRLQRFALGRHGHDGVVAALFDLNPGRRGGDAEIGFDFRGGAALGFPELQRGQTVAMHHGVHVRRVGVQRLADEESGFAVDIGSCRWC